MEVKKKRNKGLIVLVVLLFLIILGLVGYICYDKGVFDGLLGKDKPVEEAKKEEKLSDEEVKKLHDSLLTKEGVYGFYFKDNVTIDDISDEYLVTYLILKYIDEKNINENNYNLECIIYSNDDSYSSDENCKSDSLVTITKNELDDYTKKLFNTNRVVSLKPTSEDGKYAARKMVGVYGYVYDIVKQIYYLGVFPSTGGGMEISTNYIKAEQENDSLYIYDKAIVCYFEFGSYCYSYIGNSDQEDLIISFDVRTSNIPKGFVKKGDEIALDKDYVFNNMNDKLNTFKHTFKKANDGKYYWYSSEIVNE